uniref:Tc1-like transposase DDE domain-containing protein n=1 Tax=Esox lucius TaxID=8010 RepID=A0AAY5KQ81_ESOLU
MFQHDNARPHVARIRTQFLEAENIPVLAWPAYVPDMSPIEHVWDDLDQRIQQCVPGPANIQQRCTAIEEEWNNIPQATVNNLINSMRQLDRNEVYFLSYSEFKHYFVKSITEETYIMTFFHLEGNERNAEGVFHSTKLP